MGCLLMPPPPLCANDANENELPPSPCEGRPMPPDGEVDDGLTDWLGPPCCWACSCCCHCCCCGCCSAWAATRAPCSVKLQTTRAAILWVVVLLSSPEISIPSSCYECEI